MAIRNVGYFEVPMDQVAKSLIKCYNLYKDNRFTYISVILLYLQ